MQEDENSDPIDWLIKRLLSLYNRKKIAPDSCEVRVSTGMRLMIQQLESDMN